MRQGCSLNQKKINEFADLLETPVRLAMHGVPWELVEHATPNQLSILWEIVVRDETEKQEAAINTSAAGIAQAFGGN